MARILLIAAIFFLSFSENLSAAEIQMKPPTSTIPLILIDSPACVTAFRKCKSAHDSKDFDTCGKACQVAEDECQPNQKILKPKTDLSKTNYGRARNFRQYCQNIVKTKKIK